MKFFNEEDSDMYVFFKGYVFGVFLIFVLLTIIFSLAPFIYDN